MMTAVDSSIPMPTSVLWSITALIRRLSALPLQEMLIEDHIRREAQPVRRHRLSSRDVLQSASPVIITLTGPPRLHWCRRRWRRPHAETEAHRRVRFRDFFDEFVLVATRDPDQRCRLSARRAASRFVKSTFAAAFAPCTFHIATELSPASGSAEACGSTATIALEPPASSSVRATTASLVAPPPTRTRAPGRDGSGR